MKFECKRNTRILSAGIKYFIRDLICDVINYCASSFVVGKISVHDQIVIKKQNPKKRIKKWTLKKLLPEFTSFALYDQYCTSTAHKKIIDDRNLVTHRLFNTK